MSDIKITHVAAGILIKPDGAFLLGSRPEGKPYAGYWEFPGGKLEAGETPYDALKRELHEEMGVTVTAAYPWMVQTFTYPHATVRLNFFKVTGWEGVPHPHEGQSFAWQAPGALTVEPMLPANTPILRGLALPEVLVLSNVAELGEAGWLQQLEQRLASGLRWLVLREPQLDDPAYANLARQTIARCHAHGARLVVHGRPALAAELGADGVHLTSAQLMATQERPDGWCGASVHSEEALVRAAALGLDYTVLGSIRATQTHPGGAVIGWDGFSRLVAKGWPFPVYGIGGMTLADLHDAHQAGAQGVAMIRAAWA
ncbi:MAG: Nudix family hydrolase [Burkholderiales bacterium]|nr:Nudix family hydrolase [Burkholderiales bacterium]